MKRLIPLCILLIASSLQAQIPYLNDEPMDDFGPVLIQYGTVSGMSRLKSDPPTKTVDELIEQLEQREERRKAIIELPKLGAPAEKSIPALSKLLMDEKDGVAAAEAILRITLGTLNAARGIL